MRNAKDADPIPIQVDIFERLILQVVCLLRDIPLGLLRHVPNIYGLTHILHRHHHTISCNRLGQVLSFLILIRFKKHCAQQPFAAMADLVLRS